MVAADILRYVRFPGLNVTSFCLLYETSFYQKVNRTGII